MPVPEKSKNFYEKARSQSTKPVPNKFEFFQNFQQQIIEIFQQLEANQLCLFLIPLTALIQRCYNLQQGVIKAMFLNSRAKDFDIQRANFEGTRII